MVNYNATICIPADVNIAALVDIEEAMTRCSSLDTSLSIEH